MKHTVEKKFNYSIVIFFFAILTMLRCDGTSTSDVFKKYPNTYFVETGSYLGDGIQNALDTDNFEEIYSIELSSYYYKICKVRFADFSNVYLYRGDSSKVLKKVIKKIDAPATFWLDGHYSAGNTARGDTNSPILNELEIIKNHKLHTHTILIDDVRLFGTEEFDFVTLDMIIAKLLEINPNYTIVFENGYVNDDILVAYIKKKE